MTRVVLSLLSCFLVAACATASSSEIAEARATELIIRNATIPQGATMTPQPGRSIVVRQGRIVFIGSRAEEPADIESLIDAQGRLVLPGFIDAHVHLRNLQSARNAVRSGVTTARSLGVDHFADVAIAGLHAKGAADVPDVIAAGYHVRRRLADAFFLDAPELYDLAAKVEGEANIARVVRANARHGVDAIKIMMTERAGLPETDFRRRMLTDSEARAAVVTAGAHGLPVAAHAHTAEGVEAAIEAGVKTIEHGTLSTDATLQRMLDRNVCFVPTLSFWVDMVSPGGEYDGEALHARGREMLPQARSAAARAWRMGVLVAAGSDMQYDKSSPFTVLDEVIELANSGLPNAAAIRAATSMAARCLGIESRTGEIAIGLEADLVIIDGDPLTDIRAIRNIAAVINDGLVAINRLPDTRGAATPAGPPITSLSE